MDQSRRPTVGILYPGEMGSSLGKLLQGKGHRVVTTVSGRGERTGRLCRAAGLETLASPADVAGECDVVLSLVTPDAAVTVAEEFCAARPRGIFVDMNSISPVTAARIAEICEMTDVRFVDGAVHGLASQLATRGQVFLSGEHAPAIAALFAGLLPARVLSANTGDASTFRLLLSVISKGVIALFVEAGLTAERAGLLEPLLSSYHEMYPGVMSIVDRILPTYPQHATRRAEEMREVERMQEHFDLQPHMAMAAREVIAVMGEAGLPGGAGWTTPAVIQELVKRLEPSSIQQGRQLPL